MQDPIYNDTSTSDLVIIDQAETSLEVAKAKERVRYFIGLSLSENTKKVYASGWKQFVDYCEERGFSSMPASPETVSFFVIHLADEGRKVSTISSRLAAIKKAHEFKKLPSPTDDVGLKTVLSGIRREKKVAPNRKSALITADMQRMVLALPPKLIGVRNKALLLVGFAGGFRRSELAGIDVEQLEFRGDEGVIVTLPTSKTDQEGQGQKVGIPKGRHMVTCPVSALENWLKEANIEKGPIFRSMNRHGGVNPTRISAHSVAQVVKRCALAAGLDPTKYAGHSLRSGLVTSAAMADVPEHVIMKQTRHVSSATVRGYIRDGQIFKKNAAAAVGL